MKKVILVFILLTSASLSYGYSEDLLKEYNEINQSPVEIKVFANSKKYSINDIDCIGKILLGPPGPAFSESYMKTNVPDRIHSNELTFKAMGYTTCTRNTVKIVEDTITTSPNIKIKDSNGNIVDGEMILHAQATSNIVRVFDLPISFELQRSYLLNQSAENCMSKISSVLKKLNQTIKTCK